MAINCSISTSDGYDGLDCLATSGVEEIYLGGFKNGITYATGSNNIITSFSGGTVSYVTIEQDSGDASVSGTPEISKENGGIVFKPSVSVVLKDLDSALREKVLKYVRAKLSIIAKDRRGRYWLIGRDGGCRASEMESSLGQSGTDLNGVRITWMADENEIIQEIDDITVFDIN